MAYKPCLWRKGHESTTGSCSWEPVVRPLKEMIEKRLFLEGNDFSIRSEYSRCSKYAYYSMAISYILCLVLSKPHQLSQKVENVYFIRACYTEKIKRGIGQTFVPELEGSVFMVIMLPYSAKSSSTANPLFLLCVSNIGALCRTTGRERHRYFGLTYCIVLQLVVISCFYYMDPPNSGAYHEKQNLITITICEIGYEMHNY